MKDPVAFVAPKATSTVQPKTEHTVVHVVILKLLYPIASLRAELCHWVVVMSPVSPSCLLSDFLPCESTHLAHKV